MTFTIRRYPVHRIDVFEVANGRPRVTVRPLLPLDAEPLAVIFRALSEKADSLSANKAMIELAGETGFSVQPNCEDAELRRLSKELTSSVHRSRCVISHQYRHLR
jgi:hypothetical protein